MVSLPLQLIPQLTSVDSQQAASINLMKQSQKSSLFCSRTSVMARLSWTHFWVSLFFNFFPPCSFCLRHLWFGLCSSFNTPNVQHVLFSSLSWNLSPQMSCGYLTFLRFLLKCHLLSEAFLDLIPTLQPSPQPLSHFLLILFLRCHHHLKHAMIYLSCLVYVYPH